MQKQGEKNKVDKATNTTSTETKIKKQKKSTVEKQQEEYAKKVAKNKKKIKKVILIIVILLMILIFSVIFAFMNINNNKIISGISINGIEMSGLSREEAKEKLETILSEKKTKEILLKHNEYETAISPELIEVKYNLDEVIDNAYNTGRSGNIFANNYEILFSLLGKKNLDVGVSFNEEQLNKILEDDSSKLPDAIKESSYYVENDNLVITKGKKGVIINTQDTSNKIRNALNDINNNNQDYIELSVTEQEPKEIDLEAIYNEIHTEAKDAYYSKDPFQIYPEVDGVDFNIEEAKALLNEDKEEYTIKLTITKPSITIDKIGADAFPDKLAEFKTSYDASNANRTTNLRLACEKINGKVLLAGETFSYNKVVGERTIAAGYKEAKVYEAGQVVDGLGGGICQISSTLYNAALLANLEIVERRNHQFVTSYLSAGRDATVVYGLTDFQFKNTRKYPIRITATIQSGIATIRIYGIKEAEEYDITFDTRTVGTTPYSTKYIDDASLAPGQEVVIQNGANGLQTETYIIKSLNGKVVSKSLLSKDTYTPMQKIVKRSTKSVEATTTENTEKNKQTTNTNTNTNTNSNNNKTNQTNTKTEQSNDDKNKQNNTKNQTNKTNTPKNTTKETSANTTTSNSSEKNKNTAKTNNTKKQ